MKQTATQLTIKTIGINLLLSLFKLTAGIMSHSNAMISDAVHSASDVFSSVIVMIGIHLSQKESDKTHPYGHERFECIAAILLAVCLALTGLAIGKTAIESLFIPQQVNPGSLALWAAMISIFIKEIMYWVTRFHALKLDSNALMADAWHHRSDALSSIGALIGIAGARLGIPLCDSIASFIICLFILKAAFDIFKDAMNQMVDHSCDAQTETAIKQLVMSFRDVIQIDSFQTRMFGNKIYVDLEISVDASKTFIEAHDLTENLHHKIESSFPRIKHVMIHVNPYSNNHSENDISYNDEK